MHPATTHPSLDPRICAKAQATRDARFDGLFYIAVKTTKIFCRPVCPAPSPKPGNVVYYPSAAAAAAAGFRPCLRCRPEAAPGSPLWRAGDELVRGALRLIDQGALDRASVGDLATRVGVGERHLRRLFEEHLGASPLDVAATRRLLFAKRLITETRLPMTQVADASGYASLRRFNAAVRAAYGKAPRSLRRERAPEGAGDDLRLRLTYRPPLDVAALLEFYARRAIPGVELVRDGGYERLFTHGGERGWLRVTPIEDMPALELRVRHPQPGALADVVARVRRLFDLDADVRGIHAHLARDPALKVLLRRFPGVRVPGTWDGYETAIRAVLGQQITVAGARTLATRLVTKYGKRLETPLAPDLDAEFPAPEVLAEADLTDIGVTRARAATLRTIARAIADGSVDFRPEQTLERFVERWCALPGIGTWTAHYMAMRGLGHPDAFPAGDIALRKALVPGTMLSEKALDAASQDWRPWRAYSVLLLWRSLG